MCYLPVEKIREKANRGKKGLFLADLENCQRCNYACRGYSTEKSRVLEWYEMHSIKVVNFYWPISFWGYQTIDVFGANLCLLEPVHSTLSLP